MLFCSPDTAHTIQPNRKSLIPEPAENLFC